MEELLKLVRAEMLALLPLLIALGALLKKTKVIKSNFIPSTLVGTGILLAAVYSLIVLGESIDFRSIAFSLLEGLIMGVCSVGGHQCYKQIKNAIIPKGDEEELEAESANSDSEKPETKQSKP